MVKVRYRQYMDVYCKRNLLNRNTLALPFSNCTVFKIMTANIRGLQVDLLSFCTLCFVEYGFGLESHFYHRPDGHGRLQGSLLCIVFNNCLLSG